MPETITRCWLDTCREPAHVILYASANRFAGLETTPRQPIDLCLNHGGQVYDVIRQWQFSRNTEHPKFSQHAVCPNWLVGDLRNNRLPRTSPDPKGWPACSPEATRRKPPTKPVRK